MNRAISFGGILILLLSAFTSGTGQSRDHEPIQWEFTAVPLNEKEAKLIFTANLDDGWHIYSQFLEEGGPLPTTFTFTLDRSYNLKGKVNEESAPVTSFDNVFMMEITWFKETAIFTQTVKLNAPSTTIKGKIEFMGCNDVMCLPPDEVPFSVEVKVGAQGK